MTLSTLLADDTINGRELSPQDTSYTYTMVTCSGTGSVQVHDDVTVIGDTLEDYYATLREYHSTPVNEATIIYPCSTVKFQLSDGRIVIFYRHTCDD